MSEAATHAAESATLCTATLCTQVFEQHSAGVTFDRARSGAEWWPQVRDGG